MATKNNPGKFDCYANAEPDEPMFVLLARDKHAPSLIWLWATMRELGGEDMEKVQEARDVANAMIKWQADRGRKIEGLSVATLAGVFELIRVANLAVGKGHGAGTSVDDIRAILGRTKFIDD